MYNFIGEGNSAFAIRARNCNVFHAFTIFLAMTILGNYRMTMQFNLLVS